MFENRSDAGKKLAPLLKLYREKPRTVVLGLARGGVAVAYEIASALHLPLNVVAPRKIGAPSNPELAIGAIADTGETYLNHFLIEQLAVSNEYLDRELKKERAKAQMRLSLYRQHAPLPDLKDATVILADDGMATGATMEAEIQSMKKMGVKKIVVAIPVSGADSLQLIQKKADQVVCLESRDDFWGISSFYRDFSQVEDEEVIELLKKRK